MSGRLIGILRKERPHAEPEALERAKISRDGGVEGDYRGRVSDNKVTVIAREDWQAACAELGRELPWTTRRANVLTEGIDLPQRLGARLKLGPVVLEVIDETKPCSRMEAAATGLRNALSPDWRGGVSCMVIEAGEIALGDAIDLM